MPSTLDLNRRIAAFDRLGSLLKQKIGNYEKSNEIEDLWPLLRDAHRKNAWFTPASVTSSLSALTEWLTADKLERWLAPYHISTDRPLKVGVIMAGNIPMVGFHDLLCILLSGHSVIARCSSDDNVLLPAVCNWLIEIEPAFAERIVFVDRLEKPDAVIATGSNNSARYFEYYFGKYPHIIRKNRNGVAVLDGNESSEDLAALGIDIFTYYGLGCRNISKLYVPEGYDFRLFFEAMEVFSGVMQHNKYMNNYDYHKALFLLDSIPFLTNNFLSIRESRQLATPVSVIHYEMYSGKEALDKRLKDDHEQMQCIIGKNYIPFGKSQQPGLSDYADGVDVIKFLTTLS